VGLSSDDTLTDGFSQKMFDCRPLLFTVFPLVY